jgi:NO-binding membrane sensor protein with MHYT domain
MLCANCTVADVHHFAYGPINPVIAYAMAFLGAVLGLTCTVHARASTTTGRRVRWLILAAFAIGGGIWLMHYIAMLGFDIQNSQMRYDVPLTAASAALAIGVVGLGLMIAATGRRALWKILLGGAFTGAGVAAMHYTGMAAMLISGGIGYDRNLVVASVLIAVLAATVALAMAVTVRTRGAIICSALIMGVAVGGMHYSGMAALRVHLDPDVVPLTGMDPILLVLPITLITAVVLVTLMLGALKAVSDEDPTYAEPAALRSARLAHHERSRQYQ